MDKTLPNDTNSFLIFIHTLSQNYTYQLHFRKRKQKETKQHG